ncbi:MAG TPA: DUF3198 domain-containing protein [Candidatus Thermoplasmatota archaeon]|nr:DUF3198 domain-containing protein [Candidatus Thermoplasmatota archaeon]
MAKFTKNYTLEIGLGVAIVGLLLTVVSWIEKFAPGTLGFYHRLVENTADAGDWNLLLVIVGPLLLIGGAYYFGEQLFLRARFEKLLATSQRTAFTKNRRDLEELARRLPDRYASRISEKESQLGLRS